MVLYTCNCRPGGLAGRGGDVLRGERGGRDAAVAAGGGGGVHGTEVPCYVPKVDRGRVLEEVGSKQ